jgi:gliding motility-associated-like protein
VTYQWNTIANSVSNPISGATNSVFNPGVFAISDTFYYNVQVNFSGNGCNSITSNLAQIIVAPIPLVDSIPSYVYCNADSTDLISFTSPIPSTYFTWNNSDTIIGLGLNGTGDIQPFYAYNMGSLALVSTVNVTPMLSLPDTTCTGPIESFTITVNPFQNVNDPIDTIVCHGTGLPGYFFTGTSTVYNWTNDNTSIGLGSSGSGNIPAFFTSNNTSQPITANLSVTPDFNGVTTCPGDIELFTITVLPIPTISNLSNQVECDGNTTIPFVFTGNATSYSWTNDNSTIGLASSGFGNINAFTASANSIATTGNISVTPTYTFNNLSCIGNPQNFSITVLPTPSVFPSNDTIVCEGDLITFNIFNGNANNFEWYCNNTSIGSDSVGIDLINPFLAIDTAITPISSTFFVIPINSLNGTICPGQTDDFTITIIPAADLLPISDQSVCAQSSTLPVIFSGNATNYFWDNLDPSIGLSSTGNGNLGSFVGINNTTTPITSSIFVFPEYTFNNVTCQNDPVEFQITVLPSPTVNMIQDQVICHNTPSNAVNFSGNFNDIQWFNDNSSVGLSNSGNGSIPSFIGFNNSISPEVANIYYQPSISYQNKICYGIIDTFSYTILSTPTLNQVSNQFACDGDLTQTVNFSGPSTNYEWTNSNINIGLPQSGINEIPSFNATNTTNSPLISNIIITPINSSGGTNCYGTSQNMTFTIYPKLQLLNDNISICSGENTDISLVSSIPSNFEWYGLLNTTISGESLQSSTNGVINDVLINNTTQIDTIIYVVDLSSVYCSNTDSIFVEVINYPTVDFSILNTILCSGSSVNFQNNSDPTYDYLWDFGDGSSSADFSPTHEYPNSGIYTVALTSSNNNSICTSTDSMNVTILKSPNAEFIASDTIGCGNLNVVFTLTQSDPFTSMVWDLGDGSISQSIGSASNNYTEEGCYDIGVTVTNNLGCVSTQSYNDLICVYQNPVALFNVDRTVVSVFDSEVTFSDQSLYANSIMWDFADGNMSYDDNVTYSFLDFGNYNVVLTAYNEVGCIDTASIIIRVQEDEIVFVPNTFTPNGDEGNQVFLPVIAQGYKKNVFELTIYNRWGEIVFVTKDPSEGWNGKFNYTDCQDGVYIWKLTLQPIQSFENQSFYGHVNLIR